MSQRTIWDDTDARAAVEADRQAISRPVADLLARHRAAYLADWQRRKQAGTLPAHIYDNIRRNEEIKNGTHHPEGPDRPA